MSALPHALPALPLLAAARPAPGAYARPWRDRLGAGEERRPLRRHSPDGRRITVLRHLPDQEPSAGCL